MPLTSTDDSHSKDQEFGAFYCQRTAEESEISIKSYHDILTEKFKMHRIAARFVPWLATEQQKENRVEVCLKLLEQTNNDETFKQKIIKES